MKHPFLILAALCSLLSAPCLAQTSGQSVIPKKNDGSGYTNEAATIGNSQLIGRTAAGALSGLTLGSGLSLSGTTLSATASGGTWGSITGTLSAQTDLNTALGLKANTADLGALATLNAVTSATITDGTIVNADISASAAIALSKLATDPLARSNHTGTQAWSTITTTAGSTTGTGAGGAGFILDGTGGAGTDFDGGDAFSLAGGGGAASASADGGHGFSITGYGGDGNASTPGGWSGAINLSASGVFAGGSIDTSSNGFISGGSINTTAGGSLTTGTGDINTGSVSGTLAALAFMTAVGSTQISDNAIANVDVSSSAAIDGSKLLGEDAVYDATSWNGDLNPPSKNAVRDKIEALGGGGLTIGTTTITGGTSGRWLYNNAGVVGEQALGTNVATLLGAFTTANLDDAISDGNAAYVGAVNTFTAAQTIDGSADAIQMLVQGHSTQTSSPLVVEKSDGTNVFEITNDGRIEGVADPGFPQFTASNKTNSGMRVYSDRVDFWENGSALITLQSGTVATSTIAFTGGYLTLGLSGGATGPIIRAGSGSPEGVITAPVGSIYTDSANGDLYRKTSGTGNTGWVTP